MGIYMEKYYDDYYGTTVDVEIKSDVTDEKIDYDNAILLGDEVTSLNEITGSKISLKEIYEERENHYFHIKQMSGVFFVEQKDENFVLFQNVITF